MASPDLCLPGRFRQDVTSPASNLVWHIRISGVELEVSKEEKPGCGPWVDTGEADPLTQVAHPRPATV